MKIFKWGAGIFFALVLLISLGVGGIYYANSIEETPTCISFKVSGPANTANKVLSDLQSVIDSVGMKLKTKRDTSLVWESPRATVSYYSNREVGGYSIFVCSKKRNAKLWQEVSIRVEELLQRNAAAASAWLQRNNRDFKCDPNCTTQVSMPLDFEQLNRTLLVNGS